MVLIQHPTPYFWVIAGYEGTLKRSVGETNDQNQCSATTSPTVVSRVFEKRGFNKNKSIH